MAAEALDSVTRQEIVDLFRVARGQDFQAIHDQAHTTLVSSRSRAPSGAARRRLMQSVRRLRERFREVEAIDDMFGAEFGHHGSSCTFETIAQRFRVSDPAVAWLGRIVHDLDLKEEADSAPEKAAVGRVIEGLRRMYPDDQTLLSEGITMFEALYQSYGEHEPALASSASAGKRMKSRRRRRPGRT